MTGDLCEAESLARSAFTTGLPTYGAFACAMLVLQLLRIALQKDEAGKTSLLEEVLAILQQIAPLTQGYFPARVMLARARFELGAPDDYRALLKLFLESQTFPLGLPARLRMAVLTDLAECACEMNDTRAAQALTKRLQPGLGLHISFGGPSYGGPVSYFLGLLAMAHSSMDQARALFEQAIQEADSLGAKPYRAWGEFRMAQTLKGHTGNKDADRQRALLESARIVAKQYGLGRLERMIAKDTSSASALGVLY
jgi:hypothetical protein